MRKRGLPRDARGHQCEALAIHISRGVESQHTADYATHRACEYRCVDDGLVWGFAEGGVYAHAYWFIESKTRSIEEYLCV